MKAYLSYKTSLTLALMASYKQIVLVKLTSKKAIARVIAIKLFSRETFDLVQKQVLKALKKLWLFILYFQEKGLPILQQWIKRKCILLKGLKTTAILSYLKSLPFRLWAWIVNRKLPTYKQISTFIGQEVVANSVAWTAALVSSQLLSQYFTTKSWKNMWGVFAKKDKAVIAQDTFEILDWWAAYLIGLLMLLLVHHLINKLTAFWKGN